MTNQYINGLVNRFLTWKLPENFRPDAGISFCPVVNLGTEHQYRHEPVGTNLFTADQAREMLQHVLAGELDYRGMTLRDYFAGQALTNPVICTGSAYDSQLDAWFGKSTTGITRSDIVTRQAYDFADAMLAVRGNNHS
jgi:hypothetical protein